ncbi:transmembrane protein, putative (macronuclear) [Tetrahymena thermophila SB210]|uniref:Transmembrane protein, putative n=1 Tax=Tetrahymena thermophila (strain SB210) TaxID=312017 RepID=W7XHQ5_TETTS|nr:transmembrane protein, putative [Tetrahymena thermophila SB210]EWS73971.1 transmembrane protein, putative [Tetrahymena thermophila SB210]|eukprot:XP_012653512.1 transmembrane protein, putative [Tetrahymena thermophila SB210]
MRKINIIYCHLPLFRSQPKTAKKLHSQLNTLLLLAIKMINISCFKSQFHLSIQGGLIQKYIYKINCLFKFPCTYYILLLYISLYTYYHNILLLKYFYTLNRGFCFFNTQFTHFINKNYALNLLECLHQKKYKKGIQKQKSIIKLSSKNYYLFFFIVLQQYLNFELFFKNYTNYFLVYIYRFID